MLRSGRGWRTAIGSARAWRTRAAGARSPGCDRYAGAASGAASSLSLPSVRSDRGRGSSGDLSRSALWSAGDRDGAGPLGGRLRQPSCPVARESVAEQRYRAVSRLAIFASLGPWCDALVARTRPVRGASTRAGRTSRLSACRTGGVGERRRHLPRCRGSLPMMHIAAEFGCVPDPPVMTVGAGPRLGQGISGRQEGAERSKH